MIEPVPDTAPEIWLAAELFRVRPFAAKFTAARLMTVPFKVALLVKVVSPV